MDVRRFKVHEIASAVDIFWIKIWTLQRYLQDGCSSLAKNEIVLSGTRPVCSCSCGFVRIVSLL
uniref:Uncharacterized protein n=1 Tax=Lepeophtheirus salmonis TaxID=72036 RepID=A0A0K2T6G0_LEPSM